MDSNSGYTTDDKGFYRNEVIYYEEYSGGDVDIGIYIDRSAAFGIFDPRTPFRIWVMKYDYNSGKFKGVEKDVPMIYRTDIGRLLLLSRIDRNIGELEDDNKNTSNIEKIRNQIAATKPEEYTVAEKNLYNEYMRTYYPNSGFLDRVDGGAHRPRSRRTRTRRNRSRSRNRRSRVRR